MANKKWEVVCKVSSYQDKEGKTKNRYVNVGSIMTNDDGREFMLLNRHFNPAGIPNPDNRESIILSFFETKSKETTTETPKQEEVSWNN